MKRCHKCETEWTSDKARPGFKECCEKCNAYLHGCQNCRFHDRSASNECRIPTTEWVPDKRKFNYCDDFEFADTDKKESSSQKNTVKSTFDSLFDGKLADEGAQEAKDFDSLFGE